MPQSPNVLPQSFFTRETTIVARELLGCRLVSRLGRKKTSGIIVETEAYLPTGDTACHGSRGRTHSNQSMFGVAGRAYVYPIHAGFCFNIVTGPAGLGCAVLVRSLHPLDGIKTMIDRRNTLDRKRLTTGPSRLCQSLGIDRAVDGSDLTRGRRVWIEGQPLDWPDPANGKLTVMITPRVGVTSAENLKLRFVFADNPFVSGPKRWRCS